MLHRYQRKSLPLYCLCPGAVGSNPADSTGMEDLADIVVVAENSMDRVAVVAVHTAVDNLVRKVPVFLVAGTHPEAD